MKITCPDCSTSYEIKAEAVGQQGRSVKCAKCGNRWFVSADDDDAAEFKNAEAGSAAKPDEEDAAQDEAEWAADAEADNAPSDDASQQDDEDSFDTDDEDDGFSAGDDDPPSTKDEDNFAADLEADENGDEDDGTEDIESQAKRPKIIVNPDKFRRNHIGAVIGWLGRRNFRRIGGILIFGVALAVVASFVFLRDGMVKQSPDLASLFQMIGFDVNLRGLEFRNLRTFSEIEAGKQILVVEGSIRNLLDEANPVPAVRLSIRNSDLQEVYAWTVEPRTKALNGLDETRFRTILADPPQDASDIQVRFIERGQRQIVLE
ncbi:zinc-ribbon domain-containing protein [Roseibium sp. MMSF_3412]|uniref:zinc-ribbon domain-containing protein n=1 Tax=Roseibium sp. MMSF_3412 TaxID=3046712 RepID=UPI00273DBAEB|nr:zinc-ribbon domain-containing protein [Roseibium sp. MMSF_3412]